VHHSQSWQNHAIDLRVIRYKIHAVENWMNFSAA